MRSPTLVTIHRFRRISSKPLCIEDAERVEDPILFVRPCNPEGLEVILKCVLHEVQRTVPKASILASTLCIEDARSLVLRLDLPGASQRNFNQINTSCLAMKVPLRGTFVLLCVDQAARTSGPLAWSSMLQSK